jgi:hypothetical protein
MKVERPSRHEVRHPRQPRLCRAGMPCAQPHSSRPDAAGVRALNRKIIRARLHSVPGRGHPLIPGAGAVAVTPVPTHCELSPPSGQRQSHIDAPSRVSRRCHCAPRQAAPLVVLRSTGGPQRPIAARSEVRTAVAHAEAWRSPARTSGLIQNVLVACLAPNSARSSVVERTGAPARVHPFGGPRPQRLATPASWPRSTCAENHSLLS